MPISREPINLSIQHSKKIILCPIQYSTNYLFILSTCMQSTTIVCTTPPIYTNVVFTVEWHIDAPIFHHCRVVICIHGLINYVDTKAKCRHPKTLSVKGLCGRCLYEFIDWRYSQSCWYFDPFSLLLNVLKCFLFWECSFKALINTTFGQTFFV